MKKITSLRNNTKVYAGHSPILSLAEKTHFAYYNTETKEIFCYMCGCDSWTSKGTRKYEFIWDSNGTQLSKE